MPQHTLLIASAHQGQRAFLTSQLDADGHTVYEADNTTAAIAKLSTHAIDVMILGGLERPADSPALLRAVRAGEHPRIHPGQPVITLGADDELSILRAYECGTDHHLPDTTTTCSCAPSSRRSRAARWTRSPAATYTSATSTSTWPPAPPTSTAAPCASAASSSHCSSSSPATPSGSSARTSSAAQSGNATRSADVDLPRFRGVRLLLS